MPSAFIPERTGLLGTISPRLFSAPDPLAVRLLDALRERGATLATCESLTGGAVAAALVDVPGASQVFRGGLVTYATDLKTSLAGVDPAWIGAHGVIDQTTAEQMATGAARVCGATHALATTGVAGPDPQDGFAPGTVWIAVVTPDGPPQARLLTLDGGRAEIRAATVRAALSLALESLGD